jgi:hypothetical protein
MVADQLDEDTSFGLYAVVYSAIILLAFCHNLAFFYLTKLSAVMTGINKAVQAVSVRYQSQRAALKTVKHEAAEWFYPATQAARGLN